MIMLSALIVACGSHDDRLIGLWKTESDFYNARYQVYNENDSVRGEVIYYNDGTTVFNTSETDRKFIFKHMVKEGDSYVDAVSGATKTKKHTDVQMWSITIKHEDTLAIGQKIGKQTRTELWTRVKD